VIRRSKCNLELPTDDTRLVDHACQVVEVDRAHAAILVGDVADRRADLIPLRRFIADLEPAFERRLAGELYRFIQEEVYAAAIDPVDIGIDLAAVRERDAVARDPVGDPAWRLGKIVAVDHREAVDDRIKHGAGRADGDADASIADLGEVVAAARSECEFRQGTGFELALDAVADRLVRADQPCRIAAAADRGDLQVLGAVPIGVEREVHLTVEQRALEAALAREGGLLGRGALDI
jgi:hypothetical protein